MTELYKEIVGFASRWIQNRLSDRSTVTLPLVGRFAPILSKDYILEEKDGSLTLYPPAVGLSYVADPFLLDAQRYAALDYTFPGKPTSKALVEAVAGLYEREEKEVEAALEEYLTDTLSNLFKGRRVTLFTLGDFYVSEVSGRLLMLNFEPSAELLSALNHPFSSYPPVRLPSAAVLPDGASVLQAKPAQAEFQFPIVERETATAAVEGHLMSDPQEEAKGIPSGTEPLEEKAPKEPAETSPTEPKRDTELPEKASKVPSEATQDTAERPRKKPSKKWFTYPLYFVLLVLILLALLLLLFPKEAKVTEVPEAVPVVTDTLTVTDTAEAVHAPETPPAALPKDTITAGETLVKLARKYYGEKEYWVYLYFHNRPLIEDPDNVPIGTVLEIPSLEPFDLPADKAKAIREAKDWAFVILNGHFTDYDTQRPDLPVNRPSTTL